MSLAGPSWRRPLNQGTIGKYYEFGCEVGPDNFIWNLQPQLDCDDPLYLHKKSGDYYYNSYGIYDSSKGYRNLSFFLTMSKIFYINSNKDVNIELKAEQNKLPPQSAIIVGALNPKLCDFCKVCCGLTSNGVCFNDPIKASFSYGDSWYGDSGCPDGLYTKCEKITPNSYRFPRSSVKEDWNIVKNLRTENIKCSTVFNHENSLNFNTGKCGGYFYIQIRIAAPDRSIRPIDLPGWTSLDMIHGYYNTGALKITGINPYVCSRFSKMMMTENTILSSATSPGFPDHMGNSCFSEPFFTESYIDSDISRDREHRAEMQWGFEIIGSDYFATDAACMIINPNTGKPYDTSKNSWWEQGPVRFDSYGTTSPDFTNGASAWPCNPVIGYNPVD
jgi:hypothetical protein